MFSQTKHQIEFEYFHTFMRALRCEDFAEKCYFGYSEVKVRILNQISSHMGLPIPIPAIMLRY